MKFKSIIVFLVIVISFLLVGCQTESKVPVKAEIAITNWEYKELSITCNPYGPEGELPCFVWGEEVKYPDRVTLLNIFGKEGWEVIDEIADGAVIHYLFKRPLVE